MLDHQTVSSFRNNGFLVLKNWVPLAALADLIGWTDDLQGWPEMPGKAMKYFETSKDKGEKLLQRIENFYPFHDGFRTLCDSETLLGTASQLLGEPAVLFKEKINFKLAGGEGFEPHQDAQADWGRYASLHLTAMVSVDACTPENGCLEIVAGHHRRGLIGDMWKPLDGEQLAGLDFVAVPSQPGDVIFFDSFTPHRSAPNRTTQARRVLYITYNRRAEGDRRLQYYGDKRASFPPDCEREPGTAYEYKV
jgi:ectoine hydroxylase-related dioxygenase (phytanoyl-CoA dioxygenase family)